MKHFTRLYVRLDQTNSTNGKVAALIEYFRSAPSADIAWAVWFLSGRRLKRLVKRAALRRWVLEVSGYPEWILEETYQSVGDLAETIALLLPERRAESLDDATLTEWVTSRLIPLAELDEERQGECVKSWWHSLSGDGRFVLNKLITGALRVGVSQRLVVRALAKHFGHDSAVVAHRLMGDWQPSADFLRFLEKGDDDPVARASMPYPFFLASPLAGEPQQLGDIDDWRAEWKWDGIRAQVIRRRGATWIWSRGEERMDGRFPEIEAMAAGLPDGVVLDGEILATDESGRFSFSRLQRRIGRLKPGRKMLAEVPLEFMAFDVLEADGRDLREMPLSERLTRLESFATDIDDPVFRVSSAETADNWEQLDALRQQARDRGVEGLMLKRKDSPYRTGRKRGDWWKWKVEPFTIDAVLLYAQPGSGRRSNLLTDYTFAVWEDDTLLPVCKAYSGLTNEEIAELDRWIRQNTRERFGPVRSVTPEHVFEIAFEGIQASNRHKSGVAFRFPRIARWRKDLSLRDAETLEQVKSLIVRGH